MIHNHPFIIYARSLKERFNTCCNKKSNRFKEIYVSHKRVGRLFVLFNETENGKDVKKRIKTVIENIDLSGVDGFERNDFYFIDDMFVKVQVPHIYFYEKFNVVKEFFISSHLFNKHFPVPKPLFVAILPLFDESSDVVAKSIIAYEKLPNHFKQLNDVLSYNLPQDFYMNILNKLAVLIAGMHTLNVFHGDLHSRNIVVDLNSIFDSGGREVDLKFIDFESSDLIDYSSLDDLYIISEDISLILNSIVEQLLNVGFNYNSVFNKFFDMYYESIKSAFPMDLLSRFNEIMRSTISSIQSNLSFILSVNSENTKKNAKADV